MFNSLTKNLSYILRNISNCGYLTKENIEKNLHDIRIALLEADVALPVIHDFINHIKEKAIGKRINKSLTARQEFIKMIYDELVARMGEENQNLNLTSQFPAVIVVVGPQGAGKTTNVAKLGKFLHERYKKKILITSIDVHRPAAIKQLEVLTRQISVGVDFFIPNAFQKSVDIATMALEEAKLKLYDVLLVDTAGFLHTNEIMINEIKQVHVSVRPIETLFVIDAMIGQDAANVATTFKETLSLTGIILTKIDSDTRGGVALSVYHITRKPIKFLSTGEKMEALEVFHPKRIASRILGMGDILSIIEDIKYKTNQEKTKKLVTKLKKENTSFNLIDLIEQLHQIKNMGGISSLIDKLPNIGQFSSNLKSQIDDGILVRMEAIINSMTPKERTNPKIINSSRKRRIAIGCGLQVQDIDHLLKQLNIIQFMIKNIKNRI